MNKLLVIVLIILCQGSVLAQQTEFEKWKNQQKLEFQEYKNRNDAEFLKLLEQTWVELDKSGSIQYYQNPKPQVLPLNQNVKNDVPIDNQNISLKRSDLIRKEYEITSDYEEINAPTLFKNMSTSKVTVDYFSSLLNFEYPKTLITSLNPDNFSTKNVSDQIISEFWKTVSKIDHTNLLEFLIQAKNELNLDDWGYILLINEISESIYESYPLLIRLNNWFLLTKSGYNNKVGFDKDRIFNLLATSTKIYGSNYYELNGERFYPIYSFSKSESPNTIFTYNGNYLENSRRADFSKIKLPDLRNRKSLTSKDFSFEHNNVEYSYSIDLNNEIINYFKNYPLIDISYFFKTSFSDDVKYQLKLKFQPILDNMTELESANFLLALVQKSFKYKTDQDNFSREKYMIPEETFYYEFSDCDDRSILFANLIYELLKLEVIVLRYSRHVAVGINFSTNDISGDHYFYNSKKYLVSDPTFVNSKVGMTMTSYKNEVPKLITIN